MKKLMYVWSLLIIASIVLAACGAPAATQAPAATDAPPATDAPAATDAPTTEPETGEIPRGGTVVVSEGRQDIWPKNFNPFSPDPIGGVLRLMYEPLVLFNPVEGGKPTFWLATDMAYSEDLMSVTYNLREGVKWSDGEDFNADDVVFTIDMILKNPGVDRLGLAAFTESVEKVDDFTVKVNLSEVYTQAANIIGTQWIVPEHIWKDIEDPVSFTNETPVATGPFTEVTNFDPSVYDLCRNEFYWGVGEDGAQLPYVDCLKYPIYKGNDPANLALVNGELDWVGNFVPDIENVYVAKDPENFGYYFWPGGGTVQLYFNTTKAPFDDVEFRKAVSQAIDYENVVNTGMYGYTIPANPTGIGPKHESWISQEAVDKATEMGLGQYDPEAAAATLDAAGYVDQDGDGYRDNPDGTPIAFKMQVVTGWTDWVTSVDIMTQGLQDIGLNVTMDSLDFGVWLENLQKANFDTSIGWSTSGITPWDFYRNVLDSSLINVESDVADGQLWGRWTSEEADQLLKDFTSTVDEAEQKEIINQLQSLYVENVVAIPLFPGPTWYEYNTMRFEGWPTEDNYYAQGSPWETQARLIVVNRIHCVDNTSCGQ